MTLWARILVLTLLVLTPAAASGCKPNYSIGDHVLVEWEGKDYPAMITDIEGPGKFKVHFDGYESIWDQTVTRARIKGFVEGDVVHPEAPEAVRARAMKAQESNKYKIGDRVRVEWHGKYYDARITDVVGRETYRIHYERYGSEWDETVDLSRIQPKP